jgi:hypothetical protein
VTKYPEIRATYKDPILTSFDFIVFAPSPADPFARGRPADRGHEPQLIVKVEIADTIVNSFLKNFGKFPKFSPRYRVRAISGIDFR